MRKKIGLFVAIVVIIAIAIIYYQWNKPHRTAENESASVTISADKLLEQYALNELIGDSLYLNKVVEIQGVVAELKKATNDEIEIVLATSDPLETINCILAKGETSEGVTIGTTIALKGICNGYLSMSGVNLNQGVIIK